MKNLKKKVAAIAATTAIVMTSLVGCGNGSFDNSDVVATVGDSKITAGVANFYARYQQAAMEARLGAMLGDNMWAEEVGEGVTYEENVKEGVMSSLQQLYILEDHMEDYEISLTDDEKAAISKAAEKFDEENSLKAKELISGDKEVVEEVLRLLTIQSKMAEAMTKDVDTEVSDEEAAQKSMQYVKFAFTTTDEDGNSKDLTDDEKAALKETAAGFVAGAKAFEDFEQYAKEAGYEVSTVTFDKDSTSPAAELIAAADVIGEGDYTEVVETETAFYVAKVTSLLDREATDKEKATIVNVRKGDKYNEIYEGWKKDTKIDVDKDVWAKISFKEVGVKVKQEETEK